MIESWMVNIGIALAGIIGTYAVLRNKVDRLQTDLRDHSSTSQTGKRDLDRKLDAQFKRVDICTERITILERDTSTHLDMVKAEEKFVSKRELELHLKNIELMTKNTNQKVEKIEGKLEDLIEVLTSGAIKIGDKQ
jgi:hypothetical protein